jgi:hypothetical protein
MRRFWPLALALPFLAATVATGQDEPPGIVANAAAQALVDELVAETSTMGNEARGLPPDHADVLLAAIAYRQLIVDLMRCADGAGDEGSAALMTSGRLARARRDLDRAVRGLFDPPADAAASAQAVADLRAFTDEVTEAPPLAASLDGASLGERLADRLAPLARAMEAAEGVAPGNHWPPAPAPAADPADGAREDPWDRLARLAGDAALPEPVRVGLSSLVAARHELPRSGADDALARDETIDAAGRAIDDLLALRDGELRNPIRKLEEEQGALLAELPAALADGGPALVDARDRQVRLAEDAAWLREMAGWIAGIRSIHHTSGNSFASYMRRWAEMLTTARSRDEAIGVLIDCRAQYDAFMPLPFERRLREGAPEAVVLTGGQNRELAIILGQEHRNWANEWGRGRLDTARAATLTELARLLEALEIAAPALPALTPRFADRWGALAIPPTVLVGARNELLGRLKLATASAIAGDEAGLARHLVELDYVLPLVDFLGAVETAIGAPLAELPGGIVGALGATMTPPGRGAWMVDHHAPLARAGRIAFELDHARRGGDERTADRLRGELNALLDALVGS